MGSKSQKTLNQLQARQPEPPRYLGQLILSFCVSLCRGSLLFATKTVLTNTVRDGPHCPGKGSVIPAQGLQPSEGEAVEGGGGQ